MTTPTFRIAEFWSSGPKLTKVQMATDSEADMRLWELRADFIRWLTPPIVEQEVAGWLDVDDGTFISVDEYSTYRILRSVPSSFVPLYRTSKDMAATALLRECLARIELDWKLIDADRGPAKGGLEGQVADGEEPLIARLREYLEGDGQ